MTKNTPTARFENQISRLRTVAATSFGASLIAAPHPDDETLGCGGTAALLIRAGFKVNFIFISDGTMSHPNSRKFPAACLRDLRESEAAEAVKILGADSRDTAFLAFPDRNVPVRQGPFFESAVRVLLTHIKQVKPETIFIPWENDPHPDHRATWQIVTEAVSRLKNKPRTVEYPIWLWEMGSELDIQMIAKMDTFCVDTGPVMEIKRRALAAHRSQVSDLIDDDPEGFRLSEQVIAHFNHHREVFFESKTGICNEQK